MSAKRRVELMVRLMEAAPKVAIDLMELCLVEPAVTHKQHNPLPRLSSMRSSQMLKCHYCEDRLWEWDVTNRKPQPWHVKFEVEEKNRHLVVPVHVRVMALPNVICLAYLRAIAHTTELSIFGKVSTQAMIEVVWQSFVQKAVMTNCAWRIIELCAVLPLVWMPNEVKNNELSGFFWSILFAGSARQIVDKVAEVISSRLRFGTLHSFGFIKGVDVCSILILQVLAATTLGDVSTLSDYRKSLSLVVFCRWFSFWYTLRVFRGAGRRFLLLSHSVHEVLPAAGMVLITIFTALFHAFIALMKEETHIMGTWRTAYDLFMTLIRFSFHGADEHSDFVYHLSTGTQGEDDLSTGTQGEDLLAHVTALSPIFFVIATLSFQVCVFNLLGAVLSETYDAAHENIEVQFQRERAKVCVQYMLRPHWPTKWKALNVGSRATISTVSFFFFFFALGWVAMIQARDVVPLLLPSCALLVVSISLDMALLQRPWMNHSNCIDKPCRECQARAANGAPPAQSHLWICYRGDFEEICRRTCGEGGSASRNATGDFPGRLSSLKQSSADRIGNVCAQVSRVQSDVHSLKRTLHSVESLAKDLSRGGNGNFERRAGRPLAPIVRVPTPFNGQTTGSNDLSEPSSDTDEEAEDEAANDSVTSLQMSL